MFVAPNYLIEIVDMDMNWFNDLFDGEYENFMNNIAQYVSYGYGGRNTGSLINCSNVPDDSNADDDNDNNDSNKDDDDDDYGDSFWRR